MLKLFKKFNAIEWFQIAFSTCFIILQIWLDLKLPEYMSQITKLIQTPGSTISQILQTGGFMMLCALGSLIASFIVGYFAARLATTLAFRLRRDVYQKVNGFSLNEIQKFSTASLITRSTNDVTQIQNIFSLGLQVLVKAPILAVWAILKIAGKSWQWTMATSIAVFLISAMLVLLVVFALPKFKVIQEQTDELNHVMRENLSGVRVVRAFNAEDYQEEKFETTNTKLTKTNLFINRMMAIMSPGMTLISSGLALAIYFIGASLISVAQGPDKLTIFSDMIVYSSYAMQVIMGFMMVIIIFIMLPRASVSARRINEVLDTEASIVDGKSTKQSWSVGEVKFNNVSFKYPDAQDYVLKDINFSAKPGETVAFIGSTGSGKSTLINLIPRFYDATEGTITIDDVNIKEYQLEDLYNKIGYVPQKAMLFRGTIKDNIDFGDNGKSVHERSMSEAASIAQSLDFIENLPERFDASVAQGGTNFSGGQKQRLAITRAIYREPEIFIFDDTFSALDYKTDKELRHQLEEQIIGTTTFIVAQRIGTIQNCDKIIVLDEGRIVGMGTHDELLSSCSVYQEIASSQLSKEELAHE